MSIASEILRISGNVADAYTACSNKGATLPVTQNSDNLASTIASISTGGGGKYQLLQRVTDDSNNEIGTVCGFHTDANNVEYAIVCLDAQYRTSKKRLSSDPSTSPTGIDSFYGIQRWGTAYTRTATETTQALLDFAASDNLTSPAANACRALTFVIDGVTYAGQLPYLQHMVYILLNRIPIQALDPTATQYPDFNYKNGNSILINMNGGGMSNFVRVSNTGLDMSGDYFTSYVVFPVLELPNA